VFIDDSDVPVDCNSSEGAPEDNARLPVNAVFAGSTAGGHRRAVLLRVVFMARRLGLDLQASLTWMFERRGTRKNDFGLSATQNTPEAYYRMLEKQGQEQVAA
jgi:hypothetical protein